MEAVARRIMRQASGYAWMYEQMAASAKVWNDYLNLASGAFGALVGTAGLASLYDTSAAPLWTRVLSLLLGLMIGVISVVNGTWRLSEGQMSDVLTQVSYSALARDIMWQLAQPRGDRQDAVEYIKAKQNEIEQLRVSAPIIDGRVRRDYVEKFKNNPIFTVEDQWEATLADAAQCVSEGPDDASDSSSLSMESAAASPRGGGGGGGGGPPRRDADSSSDGDASSDGGAPRR